jgi:uncharacterized membrane protein YeaQ/YmgE (transglycosylase-associated protein family)
MVILAWIVCGAILGFVARWIVPGEARGGVVADLAVGILGANIGGWIYVAFGGARWVVSLPGIVCASIGAIVLLRLARVIRGKPAL